MSEVIAKKDTHVKIRIWDDHYNTFDVEASLVEDILPDDKEARVHFVGPDNSTIKGECCEWVVDIEKTLCKHAWGYILSWPQKETIAYGTCHFVDLKHAIDYYLPYCEGKGNGRQQMLATKIMVGEKLKTGEIRLGQPVLTGKQTCYFDTDGRYFIREAK